MEAIRSAKALLAMLVLCSPALTAADDDGLLGLMTALQTHTHKLQLSLEAGNGRLADFYLHEMEELLEEIGEIEEYDGYPVGQLASAMLEPAMEALEAAVDDGDIAAAAGAPFDALLNACNACHTATEHGFIVIARNSSNPYLQSFEP
jgi:hypothetical protein